MRKLYNAFLRRVKTYGPVTVNVTKGGINFQARVRFAGVTRLKKDGLLCGFWLKRKIKSVRFRRIESIPPSNCIYQFLLRDKKELDAEVASWIAEAYKVGRQEHLPVARR